MATAWREEQLDNPIGPDCTVKVGDKEWKLHRIMLSNSSQYFYGLFRSGCQGDLTGVVEVTGFRPGVVEKVLKYIYTRDISHMTTFNVFENDCYSPEDFVKMASDCKTLTEVWMAADYFDIPELWAEVYNDLTERCEMCSYYLKHYAPANKDAEDYLDEAGQQWLDGVAAAFANTSGSGESGMPSLRGNYALFVGQNLQYFRNLTTWEATLEAAPRALQHGFATRHIGKPDTRGHGQEG